MVASFPFSTEEIIKLDSRRWKLMSRAPREFIVINCVTVCSPERRNYPLHLVRLFIFNDRRSNEEMRSVFSLLTAA